MIIKQFNNRKEMIDSIQRQAKIDHYARKKAWALYYKKKGQDQLAKNMTSQIVELPTKDNFMLNFIYDNQCTRKVYC